MRIGIIGPTETEIMPFIDAMESKECQRHAMLNFYTGTYKNAHVAAVVSGVCKVNAAIAAQLLIDRFNVASIILTGVAGALDEKLQVGDIVIADELAYHDVSKSILTEYHPWMKDVYFRTDRKMLQDAIDISKAIEINNKSYSGRIISGEEFIKGSKRDKLIELFEPQCVDMESAGVAHVCHVNEIPFLVIRSISDGANENSTEAFESNVEWTSLNSLRIVSKLVEEYGKESRMEALYAGF